MKKLLSLLLSLTMVFTFTCQTGTNVNAISSDPSSTTTSSFNYGEALQKAIYFYECQQAGPLPEWNRVEWRSDATMNDYIQGGWYDAGDHVKFNLPMAYTAAMLGWSLYEYSDGIQAVGQKGILENNLKFALDYLVQCDKGTSYVYQVGNGGADHTWWGPVEVLEKEMVRPYYETDEASAVIAESAAALAVGSIVLNDPTYLNHAKSLFTLADTKRSDAGYVEAGGFYNSWSGFWDELMWASTWLYLATGDIAYLEKAESYVPYIEKETRDSVDIKYSHTQCWDDVHYGALLLLAKVTDKPEYHQFVQNYLNYWTVGTNGSSVSYTSGGLAWVQRWGSLRYATTTAFMASIYADFITDATLKTRYNDFAKQQLDYALGDNPNNISYMIGFGDNYPQHPHHRTAHGSWADSSQTPSYHRHILYGALVGGPEEPNDNSYEDSINNYTSNEVACDYNAGIVGVLAKMCGLYGGSSLTNFPAPEVKEDEFFVEAKINQSSSTYTEIKALLNNRSAWPARTIKNLSFKYFMDLSEVYAAGYTKDDIAISTNYVEFPCTVSPLIKHKDNIYYVEIALVDGTDIYPGGQSEYAGEVQFRIAAPSGTTFWDATNDFSYTGLGSAVIKTVNIPVYDNGTLIFGTEPEGGVVLPNVAPVAINDTDTTDKNTAVATDVLANDTDSDGTIDATTLTITQQPLNGIAAIANNKIVYTPNTDYVGVDSYKYTVCDNDADVSNEATVSITTVIPLPNQPPVASDDTDTTNKNTAVTTDVLANDTDSDGTIDATTLTITQQPLNGTAAIVNNKIVYTPNADYFGTDSYKYTVCDNDAEVSNIAEVIVTVNDSITPPPANVTFVFSTTNDWGTGFNGKFTITNNGDTAITNWQIAFDWDKSITNLYTSQLVSHLGDSYVISGFEWNNTINPGDTLELGFQGETGNVTNAPTNVVITGDNFTCAITN